MKSTTALTFRIATEDWLFEAIHRLNYKTFVDGRNFEIRVAIPGGSVPPRNNGAIVARRHPASSFTRTW